MDRFAPTTNDYGLLAMPLEEAASAFTALWADVPHVMSRSDLQGSSGEVFLHLEPLSMALDRALLVANGNMWTSYFANGLIGSDVFLPVSRMAAARGCTGVRVARSSTATIFASYEGPERGGRINNHRRSIYVAREGGWKFGSAGDPYPFEDVSLYEAKRVRDRFTPAHLDDLLAGLGAPLGPLPDAPKLEAVMFVHHDRAPQLRRWTYSEVQAGLPWKRDEP
ncbi:hypothetical protein EF888_02090 [Silicimonas algicola]|uniref:Uncharacterized protein n=1 Tax=Silicimonas algicola TaxID=1826607 RepID=A0A316GTE3_9RHOB|nr:hypothetical protein [Silicimonas algicola]AZQ66022.1 hypothetical protein EF888_02090 [Silicimonas algicola]PWK58317.1 hypothetical protein C8D95_101123 [Silicimonas algicola]